jgi:phage baseplate assembly protein W
MAQLREIYFRGDTDPKFRTDRVEVTDDLEATVQQIMMTIFTKKGEVLGEPAFGLNLDDYLFEFDVDPTSLSRVAQEQIYTYVFETKKRKITVEPSIYADSVSNRDILVLEISIPEVKERIAAFYD